MPLYPGIPYQPYSFLIKKLDGLIVAQDDKGRIRFSGANAATVIQSALDALTSGRTWKEKVVLIGNFSGLDSPLKISSYTVLQIFGSLSWVSDYQEPLIQNSDLVNGNTQIDILGGYLDGSGQISLIPGKLHKPEGILFKGVTNFRIEKVHIYNTKGSMIRVIDTESPNYIGSKYGWIEQNYLDTCTNWAGADNISLRGGGPANVTEWIFVRNNICLNAISHGIEASQHTYQIDISKNFISNPGGSALLSHGTGAVNAAHITITDNIMTLFDGDAIRAFYLRDFIVKNNVIFNSKTGAEKAILLEATAQDGIVQGNVLYGTFGSPAIDNLGTNIKVKYNKGYVTENSGTATFSGDGTTTSFTIPHGLASTPTVVKLEAKTADAAGNKFWTADATNITVTFLTAPPAGTNNVVLCWKAEV